MRSDFGIEVNLLGLERSVWDQNHVTGTGYQIPRPGTASVLADGDPGRRPELYTRISTCSSVRTTGQRRRQPRTRTDPRVGEYIDAMVPLEPGSPENQAAVQEFLQY